MGGAQTELKKIPANLAQDPRLELDATGIALINRQA
jgi:hypothetical protein